VLPAASMVPLLTPPHDFLGGELRAWISDPDGNPI